MKGKRKKQIYFYTLYLSYHTFAAVCFRGIKIGGWEIKSFNDTITKGLDLQGGVSVLLGIQDENVSHEDLQKTKDLIQLRVNKLGVAETVVTTEGDNKIRVDIPGEYNSQEIASL